MQFCVFLNRGVYSRSPSSSGWRYEAFTLQGFSLSLLFFLVGGSGFDGAVGDVRHRRRSNASRLGVLGDLRLDAEGVHLSGKHSCSSLLYSDLCICLQSAWHDIFEAWSGLGRGNVAHDAQQRNIASDCLPASKETWPLQSVTYGVFFCEYDTKTNVPRWYLHPCAVFDLSIHEPCASAGTQARPKTYSSSEQRRSAALPRSITLIIGLFGETPKRNTIGKVFC